MFGKESEMTPLAARKKLLLMESGVNREKFLEGVSEWRAAAHRSKEHLTTLGSIASLAGKLAGALPAIGNMFSRRATPNAGAKPKIPLLVNTAVTGTSLWLLLRSLRHKT